MGEEDFSHSISFLTYPAGPFNLFLHFEIPRFLIDHLFRGRGSGTRFARHHPNDRRHGSVFLIEDIAMIAEVTRVRSHAGQSADAQNL